MACIPDSDAGSDDPALIAKHFRTVQACGNLGGVEFPHWCERCGQGWVRYLICRSSGKELWACGECDATWDDPTRVGPIPDYDYDTFLSRQGIDARDVVRLDEVP
jgi:hypothetical protein